MLKSKNLAEANKVGSLSHNPSNLVIIEQHHMQEALKSSRLSISKMEKSRLDEIYSSFIGDRNGELPNGSASNEIGGRATLM